MQAKGDTRWRSPPHDWISQRPRESIRRPTPSVAVKTCGPACDSKPAWLVEQDGMRDRSTQLDSQVRDTERQSPAATASGMSLREYSLARERVLHWSIEAHGGSPIQVFGGDERKLLESRRSDIDKYRKALN